MQALGKGTAALLTELQQVVGDDKLIVAKDSFGGGSEGLVNTIFPMDTFCSCYRCDWTRSHSPPFRGTTYAHICQTQILEAVKLGRRGQVVLLHGEVNQNLLNDTAALAVDFEFTLAAFLIAASDSSFFGYSDGWYFNGTAWHSEYERPLGAPVGPAAAGTGLKNMSWSRQFASGTTVELDLLHKTGRIHWGAA